MSFWRNITKPGLREYNHAGEAIELFDKYSDLYEYIKEAARFGSREKFARNLVSTYIYYESETLDDSTDENISLWKRSCAQVNSKSANKNLEFARRAVIDFKDE